MPKSNVVLKNLVACLTLLLGVYFFFFLALPGVMAANIWNMKSLAGGIAILALSLIHLRNEEPEELMHSTIQTIKDHLLTQSVVDVRLSHLAEEFSRACSFQVEMEKSSELKDKMVAEKRVEQSKKAFWDAHSIAKELGFEVASKYSDYLKSPAA